MGSRRRGYAVVMPNVRLVFVDQTSAIGVKGLGALWGDANHVETEAFTTTTSTFTLPKLSQNAVNTSKRAEYRQAWCNSVAAIRLGCVI
jgi:hypothetical protein